MPIFSSHPSLHSLMSRTKSPKAETDGSTPLRSLPDSAISHHQNIFLRFSGSPTGQLPRRFPKKTGPLNNLRFIRPITCLINYSILSKSSFHIHFCERVRFLVLLFNEDLISVSHRGLSCIRNATGNGASISV
jgi:hypothetical protein